MPLFQRNSDGLQLIRPQKFQNEKELQKLVENNLSTIFNSKLVATEFFTGPVHGGRIDTLAISEENNPVIIEYKVVESSQLINQSLYYLSWINDHRGDFEVVEKYYKNDAFIWTLFLTLRRMDRYIKTRMLGRRYNFILPGKIKR